MSRTAHGVARKQRVKKVLEKAKGAWGRRKSNYRRAKETVLRAMAFNYRDRKVNKRNFRSLWILRINAFCRANDTKYSTFMDGLKKKNIALSRDVLADMALNQPEALKKLIELVKA